MEELLKSRKVLVCAGTGGVGKTTMSAALGLCGARAGMRVLVLTIDPARRLANALGLTSSSVQDVSVPGQSFKGQLWAASLDSEKVFGDFIRSAFAGDDRGAERLLQNSLYRQLSTVLSGSQEFTALVRLSQAVKSEKYDLVILDTPPSQHARDFLLAPEKIFSLFQGPITKWFVPSPERPNFIQRVVSRGTRTALLAFERVTGSQFVHELGEFFVAVEKIQPVIRSKSADVHRLLTSRQTGFVLVTAFDESKIAEADFFIKDLKSLGHKLELVVVNRAFPEWVEGQGAIVQKDGPHWSKVAHIYRQLQDFFSRRAKVYENFAKPLAAETPVVKIPDLYGDVTGLEGLSRIGSELERRYQGANS